jgi:hypothetical protein
MKNSEVKQHEAVLDRIIGARLTSVDFVLDYLILGFDGKGALTSLVWPEVSIAARVLKFGMQGYRDSLCELIPQVVSKAYVDEDEAIMISVGDGQLRIPLRQRKFPGERAIFTAPNHFLHVW